MHTTLDPYNTTEEVELTFADANFDWTNGQFKVLADEMNLFVRTASKYDDCQLMHVPNVVRFLELFTILLVETWKTVYSNSKKDNGPTNGSCVTQTVFVSFPFTEKK